MARSVEPLAVGKVIGDVIDMFSPSVEFYVHYGSKQIANGCEIKPSVTSDRPKVQINGSRLGNNLYTLIMTDPDAPSPSEPTLREWLHWIVVDIPGGSDVTKGKEVVPYMGPRPPTGIHRYVFTVFQQKDEFPMRPILQRFATISVPGISPPKIVLDSLLQLSISMPRKNRRPENVDVSVFRCSCKNKRFALSIQS